MNVCLCTYIHAYFNVCIHLNFYIYAYIYKVIFVGSPAVGVMVAKAAADNLTPVVLELGGKDPFVICDDADVKSIIQTACRGTCMCLYICLCVCVYICMYMYIYIYICIYIYLYI
jgi:hypothetical protein